MANIPILLFRYKTNHKFRIFNLFRRSLIEIRFNWIYQMIFRLGEMPTQWYLTAKINTLGNKVEIKD